jgi:hypothetical protein
MLDLSTVFCRPTFHRSFISTVPCGEDTSGDVVFEKLFVYYVDDSRNDCFDILLSRYQGLYVICVASMLEYPGAVQPLSLTSSKLQKRMQPLHSSGQRCKDIATAHALHRFRRVCIHGRSGVRVDSVSGQRSVGKKTIRSKRRVMLTGVEMQRSSVEQTIHGANRFKEEAGEKEQAEWDEGIDLCSRNLGIISLTKPVCRKTAMARVLPILRVSRHDTTHLVLISVALIGTWHRLMQVEGVLKESPLALRLTCFRTDDQFWKTCRTGSKHLT